MRIALREALQRCELVVVSDCVARTDTLDYAHVPLPAAAWGEKDGTVTNSERRISRQRAFLPLPGEARPDWWIVGEVARRMGFGAGVSVRIAARHFRRACAASPASDNDGDTSLRHRWARGSDAAEYESLEPVQWPVRDSAASRRASAPRDRADSSARRACGDGRFFHPDGKARFVATPPRAPANAPSDEFPLVLNTGRIRDQWHTMTRTGRAARLADHICLNPSSTCTRRTPCSPAFAMASWREYQRSGARWPRACAPAAKSPAARCSCRSTGARRTHPMRASAHW